MQSKGHFAEGALAKDAAYPVELAGGGRRCLELLEVESDHFA